MKAFLILSMMVAGNLIFSQDILRSENATVRFISEAPLEIIKAESNECIGLVRLSDSSFLFRVRMRTFKGFNSPLQEEHFNENYLESYKFPVAQFKGHILSDISELDDTWRIFTIKGDFEIHGVTHERVIKVEMRTNEDGFTSFRSEFEVRLEDHGIDVPRIVFEKLAETIQVSLEGELK